MAKKTPGRSEMTGRFMSAENVKHSAEVAGIATQLEQSLKMQGKFLGSMVGGFDALNKSAELYKDTQLGNRDLSEDAVKRLQQQVKDSDELASAITNIAPGMTTFMKGAETTAASFQTMLGPIGIIVGIAVTLAKLWTDIAKAVAETRKDLGVSAWEAAKLNVSFKGLEFAGKAFGLEMSDIKASFKAARDDLGATTDEALGLSLNLAKVAMESGTTASELTTILSTMESVSSASREVLLNQIEMNRQLIEQAGLAPGDIFSEIAQQTEFFAQFAKEGGDNMIRAGIAAKQLGLDMSAVKGITESLLNFESSIAGQLEASMLLGRAINLDRARQLALTGDQEGMMREILKQVGGEAEFNKMNVLQRDALAKSVGVSVEQLSRLVRNNTAGAVGTAAGAAAGRASENVFSNPEGERLLGKIARNTEGL